MSATSSIVRNRRGPNLQAAHKRNESLVTQKQREIHAAYCNGEQPKAIADRLGLSRTTVWEAIQRVHRANKDARLEAFAQLRGGHP